LSINEGEIRFYLYFPSREKAVEAQHILEGDPRLKSIVREAATGPQYLLLISVSDIRVDAVEEYKESFEALGIRFDGEFDGWEYQA